MSTTRLYKALSGKINPEAAQMLVDYMEEKIPADIQDSIKHLATKEDVANVKEELREQIANVKGELREQIANVKGELREQIANVKGELREQIANVKGELKEQIAKTEIKLSDQISQTRVKIEESLKVQTRWMIGVLLAIMSLIVTLYIKK